MARLFGANTVQNPLSFTSTSSIILSSIVHSFSMRRNDPLLSALLRCTVPDFLTVPGVLFPVTFPPGPGLPLFLLSRLLKKLARTPSLVWPPGYGNNKCYQSERSMAGSQCHSWALKDRTDSQYESSSWLVDSWQLHFWWFRALARLFEGGGKQKSLFQWWKKKEEESEPCKAHNMRERVISQERIVGLLKFLMESWMSNRQRRVWTEGGRHAATYFKSVWYTRLSCLDLFSWYLIAWASHWQHWLW